MRYRVTVLVLLVSVSACTFDRSFFLPDQQSPVVASEVGDGFSFLSSDGARIHGLHIQTTATPKATIFLFHGSGENIVGWQELAEPLVAADYDVFMMEYRGFGLSEGTPTHQNAVSDAAELVRFVDEHARSTTRILMGHSYGGQVAIHLARDFPDRFAGLIVEGTFTSHRDEVLASVPSWLKPIVGLVASSPYKARELIREVTVPVLVIHSRNDEVVPFWMGQTLHENATAQAEFWAIDGRHALGLLEIPDRYVAKVDNFLGRLTPARTN